MRDDYHDHETGTVIWASEGKSTSTLDACFAELGKERSAQLSTVKTNAPQAQLAFDRFHVQQLAHNALDEVRRTLVAKHTDIEQRRVLKKTRFVLQKNPENHSSAERRKVAQIQATNQPLYRAMLLAGAAVSLALFWLLAFHPKPAEPMQPMAACMWHAPWRGDGSLKEPT